MKKELRKKIELELSVLINHALTGHNKAAAAEISKHIHDGAKSIAKKFVKHMPETVNKKTPKNKKAGETKSKSVLTKPSVSKKKKQKKVKSQTEVKSKR